MQEWLLKDAAGNARKERCRDRPSWPVFDAWQKSRNASRNREAKARRRSVTQPENFAAGPALTSTRKWGKLATMIFCYDCQDTLACVYIQSFGASRFRKTFTNGSEVAAGFLQAASESRSKLDSATFGHDTSTKYKSVGHLRPNPLARAACLYFRGFPQRWACPANASAGGAGIHRGPGCRRIGRRGLVPGRVP